MGLLKEITDACNVRLEKGFLRGVCRIGDCDQNGTILFEK